MSSSALKIVLQAISVVGASFVEYIGKKMGVHIIGCIVPFNTGVTDLVKQVESEHKSGVMFLDFDSEVISELSVDEKAKLDKLITDHAYQSVNRLLSPKANSLLESIQSSLSKDVHTLVLLSSNFRLMKMLGVQCKYYCPSKKYTETVLQTLKNDAQKQKSVDWSLEMKDDLVATKKDKLVVYNSIEELISLITDKFDIDLKI